MLEDDGEKEGVAEDLGEVGHDGEGEEEAVDRLHIADRRPLLKVVLVGWLVTYGIEETGKSFDELPRCHREILLLNKGDR